MSRCLTQKWRDTPIKDILPHIVCASCQCPHSKHDCKLFLGVRYFCWRSTDNLQEYKVYYGTGLPRWVLKGCGQISIYITSVLFSSRLKFGFTMQSISFLNNNLLNRDYWFNLLKLFLKSIVVTFSYVSFPRSSYFLEQRSTWVHLPSAHPEGKQVQVISLHWCLI